MKLITDAQLRSIVFGAVDVKLDELTHEYMFRRMTKAQFDYYFKSAHFEQFYVRSHATAGVRLDFITDTEQFDFSFRVIRSMSRQHYSLEVKVDGETTIEYGNAHMPSIVFENVSLVLKPGKKRITLYLPNLHETRLSDIAISDNAFIMPVQYRYRLLCLGDSITQGYDAEKSSQAYAILLADKLNAELLNQGIGSERFNPDMLDLNLGFEPNIITVAFGTNDWFFKTRKEFNDTMPRFFRLLTQRYPCAHIFAITPIWRLIGESAVTNCGSFDSVREAIATECARYSNITVIDGFTLVPNDPAMFWDKQLHPNCLGCKHYAENLYRAIHDVLNLQGTAVV